MNLMNIFLIFIIHIYVNEIVIRESREEKIIYKNKIYSDKISTRQRSNLYDFYLSLFIIDIYLFKDKELADR